MARSAYYMHSQVPVQKKKKKKKKEKYTKYKEK